MQPCACVLPTDERIRCVCGYIDAHLNSNVEVAELARLARLSPHHFSMLFKHFIGLPPHQYVLHKRICEAQRQLAGGGTTLSEVALNLGFSDQSHFSRAFRKITGTTPTRYARRAGNGIASRSQDRMAPGFAGSGLCPPTLTRKCACHRTWQVASVITACAIGVV